jgi:hypothetical protein
LSIKGHPYVTTDLSTLRLHYATSARIGGSGLDSVAHETLRAAQAAAMDWHALAYDLRANDVEAARVQTLKYHPVRMLSWFVGSEYYYGAKKHVLDRVAAQVLSRVRPPSYLGRPQAAAS